MLPALVLALPQAGPAVSGPYFDDFRTGFTDQPAPVPGSGAWQAVHEAENGLWFKVQWGEWAWCDYFADHVWTTGEAGEPGSELVLRVPAGPASEGGHILAASDSWFGSYRARILAPRTGVSATHGTVAGFFLYRDLHGEIDVEILSGEQALGAGAVRFTVHDTRGGIMNNRSLRVPLPFAAWEGFHEFGFDWYPDRVEFFVDGSIPLDDQGQPAVILEGDAGFRGPIRIPALPMPVMFNHWTGNPGWGGLPPSVEAEMRVDRFWHAPFFLTASSPEIPASSGGVVDWSVALGPDYAGEPWLLLGSASGTWPGQSLSSGLPVWIQPDLWTRRLLSGEASPWLTGGQGVLDAQGEAGARLDAPPGLLLPLAGLRFDFVALLPGAGQASSPPVPLSILP